MFCGKCGFNNPETETICQNCGAPLEASAPQPVAPPPAAPYAPQPGYAPAPYGYPPQPYQAPKPKKPLFDGPFNTPGWWESAARLASYIVGAWNVLASLISFIVVLSYRGDYYYAGSGSTWSAISGILTAIVSSALTIAVVTLITHITKSMRENAANTAKLVELKKEEAVQESCCTTK